MKVLTFGSVILISIGFGIMGWQALFDGDYMNLFIWSAVSYLFLIIGTKISLGDWNG